ncbi:unnamed protein product [Darwinula stevensoni]|uniref:Uncharacterized protein n=1 Tax=Darwinula stevensoni TaxID=69355 RepID=A0A7R8X1N7_9CRUS|nr:unnamed protein product [Darwinula stevensoni]CAG0880550.1 unnamed protein product [Darwinula stevensoni]
MFTGEKNLVDPATPTQIRKNESRRCSSRGRSSRGCSSPSIPQANDVGIRSEGNCKDLAEEVCEEKTSALLCHSCSGVDCDEDASEHMTENCDNLIIVPGKQFYCGTGYTDDTKEEVVRRRCIQDVPGREGCFSSQIIPGANYARLCSEDLCNNPMDEDCEEETSGLQCYSCSGVDCDKDMDKQEMENCDQLVIVPGKQYYCGTGYTDETKEKVVRRMCIPDLPGSEGCFASQIIPGANYVRLCSEDFCNNPTDEVCEEETSGLQCYSCSGVDCDKDMDKQEMENCDQLVIVPGKQYYCGTGYTDETKEKVVRRMCIPDLPGSEGCFASQIIPGANYVRLCSEDFCNNPTEEVCDSSASGLQCHSCSGVDCDKDMDKQEMENCDQLVIVPGKQYYCGTGYTDGTRANIVRRMCILYEPEEEGCFGSEIIPNANYVRLCSEDFCNHLEKENCDSAAIQKVASVLFVSSLVTVILAV